MDVADFVDAVRRVGDGGTALDPEVVSQLLGRRRSSAARRPDAARARGARADGRGPLERGGIAEALVLTVGAVEKHVASIFQKLRLPPSDSDHRRVLAVLAYLQER